MLKIVVSKLEVPPFPNLPKESPDPAAESALGELFHPNM
jgi:hypothetical protein